jgi:hypothetical protein
MIIELKSHNPPFFLLSWLGAVRLSDEPPFFSTSAKKSEPHHFTVKIKKRRAFFDIREYLPLLQLPARLSACMACRQKKQSVYASESG